jgi:putative endonuclease
VTNRYRAAAAPERLRALRRGHRAELLCVWHLRLRGYRILARDYRVPSGEIDIIARRFGVVVAIEVKARATLAEAGEAVSSRQRRRVARAFEHFLALHGALAGLVQRFDVMLVVPGRLPRHVRNAWRVGE